MTRLSINSTGSVAQRPYVRLGQPMSACTCPSSRRKCFGGHRLGRVMEVGSP